MIPHFLSYFGGFLWLETVYFFIPSKQVFFWLFLTVEIEESFSAAKATISRVNSFVFVIRTNFPCIQMCFVSYAMVLMDKFIQKQKKWYIFYIYLSWLTNRLAPAGSFQKITPLPHHMPAYCPVYPTSNSPTSTQENCSYLPKQKKMPLFFWGGRAHMHAHNKLCNKADWECPYVGMVSIFFKTNIFPMLPCVFSLNPQNFIQNFIQMQKL